MELYFQENLLRNMQQFVTIESEQLPRGLEKEALLSMIEQRTEENRRLMRETNGILDQHIKPWLDDPNRLSDEEADAYTALALELCSQTKILDMGLALVLHKALLERARTYQDIDRTILHLYWCGYICLRWATNKLLKEAVTYFQEACTYQDQYFSLENPETRKLLNRCIANRYVALSSMLRRERLHYAPFMEAFDQAIAFWNDPKVRECDADFALDTYMINAHQNMVPWLACLRIPPFEHDTYLAKRVYDSAYILYGNADLSGTDVFTWPNARTVYCMTAASYHIGKISAEETVERFRLLTESTANDDYSNEGIYRMIMVGAYYMEYMDCIEDADEQGIQQRKHEMRERILRYCRNIPGDANRYLISNTLATALPLFLDHKNMKYSIEMVLQMTTFSHMPTHVHSVMVSLLMERIAAYFFVHNPERFIGIAETKTVKEVMIKSQELISEIRLAGLAHDIGKCAYIYTVSLCSRRLTEEEILTIKEHTSSGIRSIREFLGDGCVAAAIQGHHRWYDGTNGYPDSFDNVASPYRFVLDIVSVADSIDAATDKLGRSYASQLTFAEVVAEINEQAGTRYSPVVARALLDEKLYRELEEIVDVQREQVCFDVYRNV